MNKRVTIVFAVLGIILLLTVLLISPFKKSQENAVRDRRAIMAARGLPEDPDARLKWEMRRLVDPATGKLPDNIRSKELDFAKTLPTKESLQKLGKLKDAAVYTWDHRGPKFLGGRTRALGMDIRNQNIILAGGVSGNMWRSTNGGDSWTNVSDPLDLTSITCLTQDTRPGHQDTWYYGSGEGRGNSASTDVDWYSGNGLFKSTNNGLTWFLLSETATDDPQTTWANDFIWNVAVDVSNSAQDEVYFAMYGAIQRSPDGGSSWSYVLIGNSLSRYVDVAVTSTGIVYATMSSDGDEKGLWRSTDGTDWTNITPGSWPYTYGRTVIGIAASNENVVYFLSYTSGSGLNDHSFWKYTYISGDGSGAGGTWEDRSSNLPAYGGAVGNYDSQKNYNMLVKVKPDNENVVFIGGTNLYRSNDGFATAGNTAWIGWYNVMNNISVYPDDWVDQHALVFYSTPTQMIVGCDGGVFKSSNNMAGSGQDGAHEWTSLNNGYLTTQFYAVAVDHATYMDPTIIGGMQDNGTHYTRSTNYDMDWEYQTSGDGCFCAISDGGFYYYSSAQYAQIFRDDFDASGNWLGWARIDPVVSFPRTDWMFVNPYTLDPNNTDMMYLAAMDRLWRNHGLSAINSYSPTSTNWTEMENSEISDYISAIGVSTSPANRVYYGGDSGSVRRLDSANTGDPTPTDISTGKGLPSGYVSCIAVDPHDGDNALLVFSNYSIKSLFYTSDGGSSWTDVSGNLEQYSSGSGNGPSCRWASILHYGGSTHYFVGTSTGLYSTTNLTGTPKASGTSDGSSTTWVHEGSTTMGNVVVDMTDTRESDGLVVVGTHGKGIYSTNISTGVDDEPGLPPTEFALEQNYPNPFNPTTHIRFSLPTAEHVVMKVYDARGREVASLLNERRDAGRHEVLFDAGNLPSGVYICRIKAGQFSDTRKLNLLK